MSRIIVILIANFFVVDYGVVPDGKDQSVYVIQIEPEVAVQLIEGYVIESVIPPELRGIRKFRIQIGNETLIKPDGLLPALEGQGGGLRDNPVSATTAGDGIIPEVSETDTTKAVIDTLPDQSNSEKPSLPVAAAEILDFQLPIKRATPDAKPVDQDAFPLQPVPEDSDATEQLHLIPNEVAISELPGSSVGSAEEDKNAQLGLEPDETILPPLTNNRLGDKLSDVILDSPQVIKQSDAEAVVIPVFDNPDSEVLADSTADIEQGTNQTLASLANSDTEDRIILGPLPDLVSSSSKNASSELTDGNEPALLEDEASNFVRLATATSSGQNVSRSISSGKATASSPIDDRSWPLFSITLLGLLISIGGNVYLGLTILDFYRKSRRLSSDLAKPE